jgi:ADP-ribose pyrophosphatase
MNIDTASSTVGEPLGDHTAGEIEIAVNPRQVREIEEARRAKAAAMGLDGSAARVGVVCEDEYVRIVRDPVVFPDGHEGTYLRIVELSGLEQPVGAAVLPILDDTVYLRRMYRHALRSWELEIPRGFRNPGHSLDATAIAELDEELGLTVRELIPLGVIAPNSGLLSSTVAVFCAFVGENQANSRPEANEAMGEIVRLSADELADAIKEGVIRDAFTLSALHLAQVHGLFGVGRR